MREEFSTLAATFPKAPSWRAGDFKGSPIVTFVEQVLPKAVEAALGARAELYTIQASAGQGGWTHTPWVVLLDPTVTSSVEEGFYVVYALRNYSQHQEAPINLIQVNGRRDDTGKMVHDFELTLDRDKLLSDKRLKASVRNELSAMGSTQPIIPLATAYMRAHRKFALDLLLAESPRLGVLEDFARSVFTGGGIPDGSVPFILEGGALGDVAPETPVNRNVRTLGFDELILLKVLAGRLQVDPPPRIEMGLGWIAQAKI